MPPLDTSIPQKPITLRRLKADDVASYREIRLEGLKNHPEAFSASWEDEAGRPASWWMERLQTNAVFGASIDHSSLLGVAGLRLHDWAKLRHKAILWGVYIRPQARRTGLAASLVRQIVEQARPLVEEIGVTVVASNTVACRLYSAAGFKPYGLERRALKIGHEYYDEVLMALPLQQPREPASRSEP
jgi:RimJ/RimL family protein N-acetyltransferase